MTEKRVSKIDEWIYRIVFSFASPLFFYFIHYFIESYYCTGECPAGGMGCYVAYNCFIAPSWMIPYWTLFTILVLIGIYYCNKFVTMYWLYEEVEE